MLRSRRRTPWLAGGLLAVLAVGSACSGTDDRPGDTTGDSTEDPQAQGTRDPRTWPYPSDSIWNHPRGADARLVPFPVEATDVTLKPEEDVLIVAPDSPLTDVHTTTAGWNPDETRCGEETDDVLVPDVPIPTDWATDPGYFGRTPNQSAAVLMPDNTLVEMQPFHVCADGTAVAQYASSSWRGSSILTGGVAGDIGGGSHGGSGMTAFGGTIRLGEWTPGSTIRHALKVTVDGRLLSTDDDGHRWPAPRADVDFASSYQGSNTAARMGALLTLAPDFDVDALGSEPARILAQALKDYGAYVVDGAGNSSVGIAVEWGPQGRVYDEFESEWGYSLDGDAGESSGDQGTFLADIVQIEASLQVVDDNGPDSIGGAGTPMAPFAPPLAAS